MFHGRKHLHLNNKKGGIVVFVLCCEAIVHSVATSPTSDPKELIVAGLLPMTGTWPGGHALLPALQMGIRHVNRHPDILPGYKLRMVWNDTKTLPRVGTDVAHHLLSYGQPKIAVLGAVNSDVSEATSIISYVHRVVQISSVSISPSLSDKNKYPWFFRISAPDTAVSDARIELIRYFGWKRVAILYESNNFLSQSRIALEQHFPPNNITLMATEVFQGDPSYQLRKLKDRDARIIFGFFVRKEALKVFCEAYKLGMYGKRYVWIIVGWYEPNWYSEQYLSNISCTEQQMIKAIDGYFDVGDLHIRPDEQRGIANIRPSEFNKEYNALVIGHPLLGSTFRAQAYDSVWAVAVALNNTLTQLIQSNNPKRLESFSYDDLEMTSMIYNNLKHVDFQGLKGRIRFDDLGDPIITGKIERFQNGSRQLVGIYHPSRRTGKGGGIEWLSDTPLIWKGGKPPRDATHIVIEKIRVPMMTYAILCVMSGLGIIVAVVFLTINVAYRKTRIIKMSSPNMNNVILVGCMVTYSDVFVQELHETDARTFCKVKPFVLTVGFAMAFGALFFKTWRIHVIFANEKLKKKVVKDGQLLTMVAVLVFIDLVVLIVWIAWDPPVLKSYHVRRQLSADRDTDIRSEVTVCESPRQMYYQITIYAIQGLLLIFGTFLAWETRKANACQTDMGSRMVKVKIPALNDSQYIGMCIYNTLILSMLAVTLSFILQRHQQVLQYALTSGIIILGTTLTQLIIFVPKLSKLHESRVSAEMEGEYTTNATLKHGTTHVKENTPSTEKILNLEKELLAAKTSLYQKDIQIKDLQQLMGNTRPKTYAVASITT